MSETLKVRELSENVRVRFGHTDGHVEVDVRIKVLGVTVKWETLRIEPDEVPIVREIMEEAEQCLRRQAHP